MTIRGCRYSCIVRFSRHNAFPNGEGKEEAASPQKRKPSPPRCARQPLPRDGARVDTPSFLWKEVPRRGGGWGGKRYPRHKAFPAWGRWRAERAGWGSSGMKDKWGNASQIDDIREHPIHRCAVPLPQWGRLRNEDAAIPDTQPSPRGEGAPKGRIGF